MQQSQKMFSLRKSGQLQPDVTKYQPKVDLQIFCENVILENRMLVVSLPLQQGLYQIFSNIFSDNAGSYNVLCRNAPQN